MRKMKRKQGVNYSNESYMSIFVGKCESRQKLLEYIKCDHSAFRDGFMSTELGDDFCIDYLYDDYLVIDVKDNVCSNVDELFDEAAIFKMEDLKAVIGDSLDDKYNSVIILGGIKYDNKIKEVKNKEYGEFKFLCVLPGIFHI